MIVSMFKDHSKCTYITRLPLPKKHLGRFAIGALLTAQVCSLERSARHYCLAAFGFNLPSLNPTWEFQDMKDPNIDSRHP